ncbi:MAG: ATP synthase F1 subunit delta [Alphaproteobacteria bacterium]|nr:ATP synthase F1 subunit delta [Alphaproteobacteria bacterium]
MPKPSTVKISETYANALLKAAMDGGVLKNVAKDMSRLIETPNLSLLSSPFLPQQKQDEVLHLLAQKCGLNEITVSFLRLLINDKVLKYFQDIAKSFDNKYSALSGITDVIVETVQPLSDKQSQKLKDGLEKKLKKEVRLQYRLNENLLGGLILYVGSTQIDDSISSKVNTIAKMMKGF